jgi:transglutaminase-like putative cysteine protease
MKQGMTLDNLRWLLLTMALVMAPLLFELKPWLALFALLLGAWRYQIAIRGKALPRLRVLLPLTLLAVVAVVASHGSLGRNASVALLTLMMALKLLESNSRRDAMLLVFLSCFLSITGFLFTQSLLLGTYLLLPLLALTITLIGISHPNGILPLRSRLRLALTLLGQAVPLMLVLFLLFPRLSGPLWRLPQDAASALTGLSESMSPGSIIELIISDEIAFRAEFSTRLPEPSARYWRGPVFWFYDGRSWRPGMRTRHLPPEPLQARADPVSYSVTVEPHDRSWLFTLDISDDAVPEAMLNYEHQLLATKPVHTRLRYQATSYLQYRLQPELDDDMRQYALQLPSFGNPRTRTLGREWAASGVSPAVLAQKALTMFREQPFVYTLTPPALGRDSVDEFLFSTRSGFCEHFASSFVYLMRASGVPARVVTGYQGGTVNPLGQYIIVRQSDAHAWAEVWLPERGWVRVDPTAAVSPSRIESGFATALPDSETLPMLMRDHYAWMHRVYLAWDALNNGWNQWVLGYNQQRQLELLSRLLGSSASSRQVATALIVAVTLTMLVISWAILRDSRRHTDALQTAYARFLRKLARAGIMRLPHEGPLDFATRAAAALPAQARAIRAISTRYANLRYGGAGTAEELAALQQDIRNFNT